MKKGTFKYLEQILIDYPDYDKRIERRREEIKYPYVENDDNTGGGNGSVRHDKLERLATTLVCDRNLVRMEEEQAAIKKTLDVSHPTMRMVIETYYFKRPRLLTWEGVAGECHVSANHAKKIRTQFFEKLAKELGMIL